MDDEGSLDTVKRITLSELLHFSTPVSGTSSIFPSSSPSPPNKNFNELPPKPRKSTFFTPFRTPVILSGTISLSSSHRNSCIDHCFSFSDSGSTTVCCSLLDLKHNLSNFANNQQQIRFLAWNFLPFDHQNKIHHNGRGGILEVIRWEWVGPNADLVDHASECLSVAKLTGVLTSISPTFAVPYKKGRGDSAVGFIAEVVTLDNISNYVYFIKPCYKWRAVMNMLVGKLVVVSGLKKKLICVGGGNMSYEMFVTLDNCMVSLCEIPSINKPNWMDLERVYNGVVTGVYMHGMAVELDNKVWLSITNARLAPRHSVRVGAVISIMNFHIIDLKNSWIKMPILGTCARTTIKVLSFSSTDARSYVRTDNQSMLGKFIESLTLPAKFWMLLLVSCFRRKFSDIYSDKEILGSKKHEGMAQLYASRYLDAHHFQPQNGIFKEFCKHEHYSCEAQSMSSLKLVGPISSFIRKCETLWMSLLQKQTGRRKHLATKASDDVIASCNTIRKIISSKDLGFILIGSLKMSTLGRLQLVDATGSIDVVIPDLLQNINGENIYEVRNYKLVLEGSPSEQNDTEIHFMEAFSFRNIFELLPPKKILHKLVIYVVFYLTNSTCLSATFRLTSLKPADNILNSANEITPLFLVTHKFSTVENVDTKFKGTSSLGNALKSCSFILYAEAIVLPYKLFFNDRKLVDRSEELTYMDKMNLSKIACQFTSKRFDYELSSVPGFLCYTKNSLCQDVRILLEFKFDSFLKYEALQIGHCYILNSSYKEHRAMVLRNICSQSRILITPQIDILSVSFCFDEFMNQTKTSENSLCALLSLHTSFSCDKDKAESNIILQQSHSQIHSNSDVQIHLLTVEKDLLSRIFSKCGEMLSVLSCYQLLKSKVGTSLNFSNSEGKDLPRGNLISVCGNIENLQISHCNETTEPCHHQRMACEFVTHLNDGPHMVRVHGNMSAAYPLGFGPGANVTFHRVLLTCQANGCHRLVLTPVSFVVINSIKEYDHRCFNKGLMSQSRFCASVEESSDIITLGMFSQLNQCMEGKLYRFRCRVKTIYIMVLESLGISSESRSMIQLNNHVVNINLAGFILDDGSSLSCCWASGSRAERLLRFSEICQRPFLSSHNSKRRNEFISSRDTVGYHMEKLLKKHHRVSIKNNGSAHDSTTLGFSFISDAEEVFSCSEEKLIRLVIHSALNGSDFSIVGDVMDSNSLQLLNEEHQSLHVPFLNIPNVRTKQVESINPLAEARSILHELRG